MRTSFVGILATLTLLASGVVMIPTPGHAQSEPSEPGVVTPAGINPQTLFSTRLVGEPVPFPEVGAQGAIVIDGDAMATLGEKNANTPLRMASTTKIMTVLLGLEARDAGKVGSTVTVTTNAVAAAAPEGSATLKLQAGQTLPFDDLMAATLLASGNDGAVAIAEHVAGSEAAFVQMMNARAAQMGLTGTQFLNASGFTDDPNHHSTPLDLAVLGREAMQHPDFARWAQAKQLSFDGLGTLSNRNEMLTSYSGTTGIKTGYTALAGQCLVASATRDGRTIYAVVLGAKDRVADMTKLFDYAFSAHRRDPVTEAGRPLANYVWTRGVVEAIPRKHMAVTVAAGATVQRQIIWNPSVTLPVTAGTELGVAKLVIGDQVLDETPVVALTNVEPAQEDGPGAVIGDALLGLTRAVQSTQLTGIGPAGQPTPAS